MSLISLVIVLAVCGFLCWLVLTYIPMPDVFKKVIVAVIVLVLILWLLQAFGIVGPTIPRLR